MEKEINWYNVLKENQPDGMTDQEFIDWYQNELIVNTVVISKSHMENPHVPSNPKNTLKWALSHSEDGYEYVIKVHRFKKYSVGAITNKLDNMFRQVVKYFRTLDD